MRTSNYGIIETALNAIFLAKTKLLFPKARLIRFPIVIRGNKYIDFGNNLTTGRNCRIEVNGVHSDRRLIFGDNVNIGDNVSIRCADKITIGNNVLMGSRVLIIDNSHGSYSGDNQDSPYTAPNDRQLKTDQITIGDNVWIGEGVVIQQGVKIEEGAIIAANSVVTKNVSAMTIVGGIPAIPLKRFDREEKIWRKC